MPVSSTETVTPAPVKSLWSAPTAPMPQAVSAASAVATSSGWIRTVGITGASPTTAGSRATSTTSDGLSDRLSTAISGARDTAAPGPRLRVPTGPAPRPEMSRRIVCSFSMLDLLDERRGYWKREPPVSTCRFFYCPDSKG